MGLLERLSGRRLVKGSEYEKSQENIKAINSLLGTRNVFDSPFVTKEETETIRPALDYLHQISGSGGVKLPVYPIPPQTLYEMVEYSDILRNIFSALKQEIFRNGFNVKPKFTLKCTNGKCGKEFDEEQEDDNCDRCKSALREPDIEQEKVLNALVEDKLNENGHSLKDILREMEDDTNTIDNCYMIFAREYTFNGKGEIEDSKVKEILRGNPLFIRMIADRTGRPGRDNDGDVMVTCPVHRENRQKITVGDRCPECGKKMYKTDFVAHPMGVAVMGAMEPKRRTHYIEGEIVHGCYDDKTEILTENGWKFFKDLKITEKVAILKNGEMIYEIPKNIFSYDYNGEMVKISNNRFVDLMVTPNHRMYVRNQHGKDYGFIEAKDMNGYSYKFKRNFEWKGKRRKYFVLPEIEKRNATGLLDKRWENVKIPMDLWLEFMGYFLSEGSCVYNEERSCYHISVSQSKEKNPEKHKKIKECLSKFSGRWYDDEMINFGLTNKQLAHYLKQFGRANSKYIPRELLMLPKKQLKILLDALLLGDGSITYRKNGIPSYCTYTTSSKILSDNVQELALKCGYGANISEKDVASFSYIRGRRVKWKNTNKIYTVNISGFFETKRNTFKPELIMTKVKSKEEYSGKIYCAEVSSGILLVRRNGKSIWCGNSRYMPSLTYGFPVTLACYQKVITLMNMDRYIKKYYEKMRAPRGLLLINSRNAESLKKAWDWLIKKTIKNPHIPHPLAVESDSQRGQVAQWINLMEPLSDMQYVESRNEFRKVIGACFDDKTEILTDDGWKKFNILDKDSVVAQYNKDSKKITFIKPLKHIGYNYSGNMIKIKTKSLDLMMTPDHKCLVSDDKSFYSGMPKWKTVLAKDIKRVIIPQAGDWEGNNIIWTDVLKEVEFRKSFRHKDGRYSTRRSTMGRKKWSGDDFCRFMGIYLSEGNFEKIKTNSKNYYKVQISQSKKHNPEKYEMIKELLDRIPFNYYMLNDMKFIINSKELNEYLSRFGHSKDKFIPDIIKNSTKNQIRIFLDWFGMGDGAIRQETKKSLPHFEYGSASERLIDDIQELLIKIEVSATKYKTQLGYFGVTERVNRSSEFKTYSRVRKENITREKYDGMVYCVEVPDGFIVIRRNGKVTISGNCYGVSPIFMADTSTTGGLNNESLQITVTNRAAKNGQDVPYHEKIFPFLLEQYGITDWTLELNPSEEKDEMAEMQREAQKINNALAMRNLGFSVEQDHNGEFSYEKIEAPEGGLEADGQLPEVPQVGARVEPMPKPSRFTGEPESVRRAYNQARFELGEGFSGGPDIMKAYDLAKFELSKEFGSLTTETPGVYNPVHDDRKKPKDRLNTMKDGIDSVTKELADNKIPISVTKQDEDALMEKIKRAIFSRKFLPGDKALSKAQSDRIKAILVRAFDQEWGIRDIVREIRKIAKRVPESALERIIRTEQTSITNAAREFAYRKADPKREHLYKWLSVPDDRRTLQCKNISNRTAKGVKMDELKKIVNEEAKKANPKWEVRDWVSHPNCRSVVVRLFD